MWSDEDCAHWRRHIADQYGLQADITGLDGEFDLNAAVFVDGSFHAVLKVMRPDCMADFVEMQIGSRSSGSAKRSPSDPALYPARRWRGIWVLARP